ncbi:sarcosine oxidase subunit gamma [Streptomyces griseiscabiei]|uniref:Sarcosine oxidase subunit gamma family protein n=1 Tax=Streptomyces griseiscabiei TaxID=2993540 RepID=A0ABU4L1Q8_9ACTN|nr:sarcosine oxidase subunit gamma family protein [Streptomyces griseiscabiei]MBZ3906010.1 sarcosine oxidase subunit gamma family protein [Streptomyces griseiscabiei]MDX2909641.1 sarcosine oxidase subunit gamma family protein [Streptomyces griseiscabiei]
MAEPTIEAGAGMGTDMGAVSGPVALRNSPLAHLEERMRSATVDGARGVELTEWPCLGMVNLRVDPESEAADRIAKTLGVPLPARCGQTSTSGSRTVVWLGPDEWLVLSHTEAGTVAAELREALADTPGSVVDVSANRTTLELTGPAAREVLEKGCPLDLHPRAFAPGQAVSTTVGPVAVLLWQVDDTPTYRLFPRSSFADYLARWLIDAMSEYGGAEVP